MATDTSAIIIKFFLIPLSVNLKNVSSSCLVRHHNANVHKRFWVEEQKVGNSLRNNTCLS